MQQYGRVWVSPRDVYNGMIVELIFKDSSQTYQTRLYNKPISGWKRAEILASSYQMKNNSVWFIYQIKVDRHWSTIGCLGLGFHALYITHADVHMKSSFTCLQKWQFFSRISDKCKRPNCINLISSHLIFNDQALKTTLLLLLLLLQAFLYVCLFSIPKSTTFAFAFLFPFCDVGQKENSIFMICTFG